MKNKSNKIGKSIRLYPEQLKQLTKLCLRLKLNESDLVSHLIEKEAKRIKQAEARAAKTKEK